MSDFEKILFGAVIMTLVGLIVWMIQANFNDLKKRLDDIAEKMVTAEVCAERRKSINERIGIKDEIKKFREMIFGPHEKKET